MGIRGVTPDDIKRVIKRYLYLSNMTAVMLLNKDKERLIKRGRSKGVFRGLLSGQRGRYKKRSRRRVSTGRRAWSHWRAA